MDINEALQLLALNLLSELGQVTRLSGTSVSSSVKLQDWIQDLLAIFQNVTTIPEIQEVSCEEETNVLQHHSCNRPCPCITWNDLA